MAMLLQVIGVLAIVLGSLGFFINVIKLWFLTPSPEENRVQQDQESEISTISA